MTPAKKSYENSVEWQAFGEAWQRGDFDYIEDLSWRPGEPLWMLKRLGYLHGQRTGKVRPGDDEHTYMSGEAYGEFA